MKLKLLSDFNQHYDHYFDNEGEVFRRVTTDGPIKREQFDIMARAGLKVPMHGLVSEVVNLKFPEEKFVVYLNEQSHCGEGKVLLEGKEALRLYGDYYCSRYINAGVYTTEEMRGVSYRYLFLGKRGWALRYSSNDKDEWRSNVGGTRIENLGEIIVPDWRFNIQYPLLAIDLVPGNINHEQIAIDLNIAPGLSGTHISHRIETKEIVPLFKEYLEQFLTRDRGAPIK